MYKIINCFNNRDYGGLYAIYNDGKVFSFKRNKFLKPFPDGRRGYLKIKLYTVNGEATTISIHKLVICYFKVFEPYKKVNHKDGNILNNYYTNLEWVTNMENIRHAIDNRISEFRKKQLCLNEVENICDCIYNKNMKLKDIAKLLNISIYAIEKISQGKNYKYISDKYKVKEEI